jgi:ParB family transcriptional regulator, chromosome partitioning protein
MIRLDSIKPYPNNAKKHDQTQISNVAQSIKEFGFVQPIVVDKNNVIIIGHCRYLALIKLGYEEIPDDWVKKVDLSEADAERLRLLDNKTNESEWDNDLIQQLIPDLDFSMFDIDWNIEDVSEPDIEEKELAPYTKVHYLVTTDVNNNDRIIDLIDELRRTEGVEVESTLN